MSWQGQRSGAAVAGSSAPGAPCQTRPRYHRRFLIDWLRPSINPSNPIAVIRLGWFLRRTGLAVLPGMTGWWQVNGRKQPMHEHVEEDLDYVRHRCLALDLRILVRTVGAVLGGNGAR